MLLFDNYLFVLDYEYLKLSIDSLDMLGYRVYKFFYYLKPSF